MIHDPSNGSGVAKHRPTTTWIPVAPNLSSDSTPLISVVPVTVSSSTSATHIPPYDGRARVVPLEDAGMIRTHLARVVTERADACCVVMASVISPMSWISVCAAPRFGTTTRSIRFSRCRRWTWLESISTKRFPFANVVRCTANSERSSRTRSTSRYNRPGSLPLLPGFRGADTYECDQPLRS